MLRFDLSRDPRARWITGVVEPAVPAITAGWMARAPTPVTVLVDRSLHAAEQWAEDTRFFLEALAGQDWTRPRFFLLPPTPDESVGEDRRVFDLLCDRLAVLSELARAPEEPGAPPLVLATSLDGLLAPAPPLEALQRARLTFRPGQPHAFQKLVELLARDYDYDAEAVCEEPGQFAVRGGLIDIYPLNESQPFRIDFFGDEIESIRAFDPTTQRSGERVEELQVVSARLDLESGPGGGLLAYLQQVPVTWILREPELLEQDAPHSFQFPERQALPQDCLEALRRAPGRATDHWLGMAEVETGRSCFHGVPEPETLQSEPLANYRTFPSESAVGLEYFESEQGARTRFLHQLLDWQREGYQIWLVHQGAGEADRLREHLDRDPVLSQLHFRALPGNLHQGFLISQGTETILGGGTGKDTALGLVVATDSEVFGRHRTRLARLRTRKLPERPQVDQLLDFSELADGDALVHLQHGIGLYRGLSKMEIGGKSREVISIEFAEAAMLHVPLHESHLLTRYVGLTKSAPKLARLGSRTWERARSAAEKATLDFAAELLNLQARRDAAEGFPFSSTHPWLEEFENSFIYQETPDQQAAITATRDDMAKPRPMDRLVCGDVGFGKTEVALRAAFLAVLDGKQVCVLVPTTVLCQQHFNTFRERMAQYPVVVEMASRFRKPGQNRKILEEVRQGRVDILIGTHRLLSRDVEFRDLGLLVIDEEQRFGVRQKEVLKRMKAQVDILALSATPIPRTLYMALVGAREMSVIETPPRDRLPIHTQVKPYSHELARTAIRQEIERGGQVFYLHNRVQTIDRVAARLEEMFPELRIAVGHGQMDERLLEIIMTRFVAGEYDVLVCTTIIESGIDIPNCNTIIIEGADRFGLAQLYQLRGRVGRFKRQAYCHLLLHQKTHLKDHARKRLASIRQYNQLGAGFRIAMRDLELRGAGNLLGAEQSGHIAGVGFDLYCQLLRQSIARLKGEPVARAIRATLRLDFIQQGDSGGDAELPRPAPAETPQGYRALRADQLETERIGLFPVYLPEGFIPETRLRIDFYRQLAMADRTETVAQISEALRDRFGPIPLPAEGLLAATLIRVLAEQKGISEVESEGDRLKLKIAGGKVDNYVKIGPKFPRLTQRNPLKRLQEIIQILKRLPEQT